MDCPDFGVCNPSVIQPNVRRQATFLNRDTESVVALTPNIELVVRRSSLIVGRLLPPMALPEQRLWLILVKALAKDAPILWWPVSEEQNENHY
jgi:hypothetical protein